MIDQTKDTKNTYTRGIVMSGLGMIILSPDTLLLRMVAEVSVWDILFYRSIFIFMALAVYLLARHRLRIIGILRHFGRPGLIATALMTSSNITFVGAIANTSVAHVLVILATMPFFGAILAWMILDEPIKPRTRKSIFFAILGIVIIFSGSLGQGHWFGDVLAIVTAFLMGLNLVVLRKYKDRDVLTPSFCFSGLIVALLVLPLANPVQVPQGDIEILMLMGVIIVPVSMILFLGGARYAPAAEIALLSLIETVLGPIWVWLGVGEPVGMVALIGGAVVITAIVGNALLGVRAKKEKAFCA